MSLCDADCYPVILVVCRLSVSKFISVLYVVIKIWFDVNIKYGATSKTIISTCPQLANKLKEQNGFGAVFSVLI